jgi:hypothetical protein
MEFVSGGLKHDPQNAALLQQQKKLLSILDKNNARLEKDKQEEQKGFFLSSLSPHSPHSQSPHSPLQN